jgi:hypothetical protein
MAGLVPAIHVLHSSQAGPTAFCTWELQATLFDEFTNTAMDWLQDLPRDIPLSGWFTSSTTKKFKLRFSANTTSSIGSRKWKVRLILAGNPEWNDLYDSIT